MSSTTTPESPVRASSGLSDTEWIVIVVVLVIILIVLIIAVAKCLEIGRSPRKTTLLQDGHSMRSETARSTTTRSIASTKKSNGPLRKMPLNAEITRFSAGRVSRSAEYGVVIKDIRKAVQNEGEERMSPPPSYHQEQTNTLHTYRPNPPQQQQQQNFNMQPPAEVHHITPRQTPHNTPIARRHHTLTSPPNANLIVNHQYASQGLAPPNSKAVFVASDDVYSNPYANNTMVRQQVMQQPQQLVMQPTSQIMYPILTQPTVMMQ